MRVWPGRPYPLGATWDGRGVNFAIFSPHATKVELFFRRRQPTMESLCVPLHRGRTWSGTGTCPTSGPGSSTATACTAPGIRSRRALQPGKAAARSVREDDRPAARPGIRSLFGFTVRRPGPDATARIAAPYAPLGRRRRSRVRLGRRRAAAHAVVTRPSSTSCTSRASPRSARVPEAAARHVSRPRERAGDSTSARSRRHRRRADARTRLADEPALVQRGLTNYWGYNTLRLLRARRALRLARLLATVVDEFKTMVRALHAAGLEVILDVVYNHTAEGNHLGPTLSFRGIDNATYYRLDPKDRSHYEDFTGSGQHAQHAVTRRCCAHHGQPALLGARDARGRLPLRSRIGARARTARGRSTGGLLRRHPPGPGHLACEAHRRAVGRRRRRLSGRQLSAGLDRVERQVSRHRAPLLEGRRRHAAGTGDAPRRQQRPLPARGPQPAREHQFRHLRTTASRSRIS